MVAGGLTLSRNNSSKFLLLCGVITAVEFNNYDGCAPEISSSAESFHFGFHIKPEGGANRYEPISLTRRSKFPLQFSSTVCNSDIDSASASGVDSIVFMMLFTGSGVVSVGSTFSSFHSMQLIDYGKRMIMETLKCKTLSIQKINVEHAKLRTDIFSGSANKEKKLFK